MSLHSNLRIKLPLGTLSQIPRNRPVWPITAMAEAHPHLLDPHLLSTCLRFQFGCPITVWTSTWLSSNQHICMTTSSPSCSASPQMWLHFWLHILHSSHPVYHQVLSLLPLKQLFILAFSAKHLVRALVISHLDYCNLLLCGLPLSHLCPLISIQNSAAKIIYHSHFSDHEMFLFILLYWISLYSCIQYKLFVLAFKILYSLSPLYVNAHFLVMPLTFGHFLQPICSIQKNPVFLRDYIFSPWIPPILGTALPSMYEIPPVSFQFLPQNLFLPRF